MDYFLGVCVLVGALIIGASHVFGDRYEWKRSEKDGIFFKYDNLKGEIKEYCFIDSQWGGPEKARLNFYCHDVE